MSASCVQLNNSKWIYDSVNDMPHDTVCNVIAKIAAGVLAVLAMIPALIVDLVASAYNYLCGEKTVEKVIDEKEALKRFTLPESEKIKEGDLNNPVTRVEIVKKAICCGYSLLDNSQRKNYRNLIENIGDPASSRDPEQGIHIRQWIARCMICFTGINNSTAPISILDDVEQGQLIQLFINPQLITKTNVQLSLSAKIIHDLIDSQAQYVMDDNDFKLFLVDNKADILKLLQP